MKIDPEILGILDVCVTVIGLEPLAPPDILNAFALLLLTVRLPIASQPIAAEASGTLTIDRGNLTRDMGLVQLADRVTVIILVTAHILHIDVALWLLALMVLIQVVRLFL